MRRFLFCTASEKKATGVDPKRGERKRRVILLKVGRKEGEKKNFSSLLSLRVKEESRQERKKEGRIWLSPR